MLTAYDAIVVGAGHNGLTLALFLQRAGLKTLVAEQADRVGGMARTEEAPAKGFRHNPHANFLAYGAVSVVEREFDLASHGLATVTPEAQHGLAFADGRPPLILHRYDLMARSADSLATDSKTDARAFAELKAAANRLDPVLQASLYTPPGRRTATRLVEAAARSWGGDVSGRSARAVIDDLFASDEVRTLFYQLAAETGLMLEAEGSGVGFLTLTLWLVGQWRLPLGGMGAYAGALARAAEREGVTIATNARVERLIVRGDRAAGVMVAGHGQVVARRAIASSAGLVQTLRVLAPESSLSPTARAGVDAYAAQKGPSLGGPRLGPEGSAGLSVRALGPGDQPLLSHRCGIRGRGHGAQPPSRHRRRPPARARRGATREQPLGSQPIAERSPYRRRRCADARAARPGPGDLGSGRRELCPGVPGRLGRPCAEPVRLGDRRRVHPASARRPSYFVARRNRPIPHRDRPALSLRGLDPSGRGASTAPAASTTRSGRSPRTSASRARGLGRPSLGARPGSRVPTARPRDRRRSPRPRGRRS